jgi:hypothetical protein
MEHRRVRLGDVIDDYCPRCRLIMNHGVVGMVGDEVKKVRCNTCLSEHQYRHGRLPKQRRDEKKKLIDEVLKGMPGAKGAAPVPEEPGSDAVVLGDAGPAGDGTEDPGAERAGAEESMEEGAPPQESPVTPGPPAAPHHRKLYTIHRAIAARGQGRGPKKP